MYSFFRTAYREAARFTDFDARTSRADYWTFLIVVTAISSLLAIGGLQERGLLITELAIILLVLFTLSMILPILAVGVRRLHDIGWSGWWVLIAYIPFIGVFPAIIVACWPGQAGSNKYGSAPK